MIGWIPAYEHATVVAARMEVPAVIARVMVLEDDEDVSRAIARKLRADGFGIEESMDPIEVLRRLDTGEGDWDVVILDMGLPGMTGLEVLHRFRQSGSHAACIMLTGDRSAQTATECMRAGAFYYLTKPFEPFQLSSMVQSAARYSQMRRKLDGVASGQGDSVLVGASAAMRKLRAALDRLGDQDVPVLIQGESGTGKELVARALHERGARRRKRFVALNCGAIPESLIDSELFGHVKGAFTGATTDRAGVFVEADGGTLFLDEIGDLPASSQAALLRVLQEKEVMPVGGTRAVEIDLRVVAATHRDLDDMVAEQSFRHDLFARLAGFRISVPPLAERRGDLGLLIGSLHERLFPAEHPGFDIDAARLLLRYPWPLNVRELEQALAAAQVLAGNELVRAEHLPDTVRSGRPPGAPRPVVLSETDQKVRDQVVAALREHQGNVSAVARALDKDRKQIQRWIKRFGLDPSSYR